MHRFDADDIRNGWGPRAHERKADDRTLGQKFDDEDWILEPCPVKKRWMKEFAKYNRLRRGLAQDKRIRE